MEEKEIEILEYKYVGWVKRNGKVYVVMYDKSADRIEEYSYEADLEIVYTPLEEE